MESLFSFSNLSGKMQQIIANLIILLINEKMAIQPFGLVLLCIDSNPPIALEVMHILSYGHYIIQPISPSPSKKTIFSFPFSIS